MNPTQTPKHPSKRGFVAVLTSGALMLFSAVASAQTPTPPPDEETDPLSMQETFLPPYQPSAYSSDPSTLRRIRIKPPARYGPGPWSTALTIHGGEFKEGDNKGTISQRWADKDLANAGYLVFTIDYRLAPPGIVKNQDPNHTNPLDGRPPEQSNDVKQQILAAYYDPDCNGKIFLLGGSAGGTHALWCALDARPLPTPATGWPLPTGTIRAVASLSGPCDLSSWIGDYPSLLETFENDIKNYTNTTTNTGNDKTLQYNASPYSLVTGATNIPPIRLFYTKQDSVPYQQANEMFIALQLRSADVRQYKVNDSNLHSFNYWHTINAPTGNYVSKDVIDFFNLHLP